LKEKKGRKILSVLGWLAVIAAFVSGSIFPGVAAVCIGIVLRMDYEERSKGITLIIMGIISGLSGPVLGTVVIWYMDQNL
jgi:hypothetical protein